MKPSPEQLEQLSAYLDGELPPPEQAMVERQLAGDAELRRELESMRRAVVAVRALPRERAPAGLAAGVASRMGQPDHRQRVAAAAAAPMPRPHWSQRVVTIRRYAVAAVILLAAGVGSWAFLGRGTAVHAPARNENELSLHKEVVTGSGASPDARWGAESKLKFDVALTEPAPALPATETMSLARKDEKEDLRVAQIAGARLEQDRLAVAVPAGSRADDRPRIMTRKSEGDTQATSPVGVERLQVTSGPTAHHVVTSANTLHAIGEARSPQTPVIVQPLGWETSERIVWLFVDGESAESINSVLQEARSEASTSNSDRSTLHGFVTEIENTGIPKDSNEPDAVQYFDDVKVPSESSYAHRRDDLLYEQVYEVHGERNWVKRIVRIISSNANESQLGEFDTKDWHWRASLADGVSIGEGLHQSRDDYPLVRRKITGTAIESAYTAATQRASPWITVIVRVLVFKEPAPTATRSSSDAP